MIRTGDGGGCAGAPRADQRASARGPSAAARARRSSARHAARFVVCDVGGRITACAELAPLSATRRRGPFARRRAATSGAWAWRRGSSANCAQRATRGGLRDALRLHARRAVLRPPELLDRAARVAAREDRHGLRSAARCSDAADSTRWCCRSRRGALRARPRAARRSRWPEWSASSRSVIQAASPRRSASAPAASRAASSAGHRRRAAARSRADRRGRRPGRRPPRCSRRTRPSPRPWSSRASIWRARAAAPRPSSSTAAARTPAPARPG